MNIPYIESTVVPLTHTLLTSQCIILLIGAFFSGLTILYLKKSDTAASEASTRNIRKGIIAIMAMNVYNIFVIISTVGMSLSVHDKNKNFYKVQHSTTDDFIQYTNIYGIPVTQSVFNSLSFLSISSFFKAFVKKLASNRKINPRENSQQISLQQQKKGS